MGPQAARFRIATMDCAVEEAEIRRAVQGIASIRALRFDLRQRTLALDAPAEAIEQALSAIRKSGFDPQPLGDGATPGHHAADGHDHAHDHDHDHDHEHDHGGSNFKRLGLALGLAIAAELLHFFAPDLPLWRGAGLLLAAIAIWAAGFDVYKKGLISLRHGRLNINALMTVAVTGAFLIGQWPEAAMVMALYAIAEAIEAKAVDRARNAIQGLLEMAPDVAAVRQPDGSWQDQPVAEVPLQAIVRVRPGERVPMDGTVEDGSSTINQAPVTGESIPVDKAAGDPVFAGTINETGTLQIRVTAAAANSTLARIIHAVEEAQATRAPTQGFVDRFAAVYTPGVFVFALAVAVLGPWMFDWTWMQSLYKALVLLVIACPCALVISTPVTVVSGLAAAARRGILIKGGTWLEQARGIRAVAFDKTGTVTAGRPVLVGQQFFGDGAASVQAVASALAERSDHPVSLAIASGLDATETPESRAAVPEADDFTALPGRGVRAQVAGQTWQLGNRRLMGELGLWNDAIEMAAAAHEAEGRSVTLLADGRAVRALFAVADTLRPQAVQAVAELRALGITPIMLTGDHAAAAHAAAREAGIDQVHASLLPDDKLSAIATLPGRSHLNSNPQHLSQVSQIPARPAPLALQAHLQSALCLEQLQRHTPEQGLVVGGMVFARATPIFPEGHIQAPVQVILHAPVRANAVRQHICRRVRRQATEVVAGVLARLFAAHLARAHHAHDALQLRPLFGRALQSLRYGAHPVLAPLLAAMA